MAILNLLPQLFAAPVVNGLATLNQSATGLSTNDSAQANADMPTAIGIQGNVAGGGEITVAGAGSFLGRVTASQSAIAGSTNSDSGANASIAQAIGISQPGGDSIAVGATGSILGTVDLNQQARSTSVAASANADAITAAVFGIAINANTGSISTGGSGSVQGLALINTSAVATTVGNNAALDGATAVQQLGTAAGLDLTASIAPATPTVVIGGLGEVVGAVAASGSASASATAAGNSSATAGTFDPAARTVGTLSGLRTIAGNPAVQVAGVASVSGSVNADFKAIASSVLGTAKASVDGSAMAVGDSTPSIFNGGQISVGDDGVFNASADLTSIAQAGSTNGDAIAIIAPNVQSVVGTALDGGGTIGLSIGGNGRLSSTATARQIGSSGTTNGSATTSFGESSTSGTLNTDIAIGGSSSGVDSTAVLIANGNASAVLGAATVNTGATAYTAAGSFGSTLTVAGDATGGIRASGDAAIRFIAESTNGDATTSLKNGKVIGLDNPSGGGIRVSGNADRLDVDARQAVSMAATSVNGTTAASEITGLLTYGSDQSAIKIGSSGVLDVLSSSLVNLSANNVIGNASAGILHGAEFGSEAIRSPGEINIGNQGLIQATAISTGSLAAQSVNGNATSEVSTNNYVATYGIVGASSSISAGGTGDIRAIAQMHGNSGANTPFQLQATTTNGNATTSFDATTSTGKIRIQAIDGFDTGELISTGASSGSLSAVASGKFALDSSTIEGNASSSFGAIAAGNSSVVAIRDSDVRAGSAGRNRVDANAALDVLLNAHTIAGTATATGDSTVNGISDIDGGQGNTILLAGDISAQARFSNTALARSVQGAATSSALNSNVLGVSQYDLTLIGSGSLTGAAQDLMRADARTVGGNAQSNAVM